MYVLNSKLKLSHLVATLDKDLSRFTHEMCEASINDTC